jgi:hypothetical protein
MFVCLFCSLLSALFHWLGLYSFEGRVDKWMRNWKGGGRKLSWTNFKVVSQHFPAGTDENHENRHDSHYPCWDLNLDQPENQAVLLTTQTFCIYKLKSPSWGANSPQLVKKATTFSEMEIHYPIHTITPLRATITQKSSVYSVQNYYFTVILILFLHLLLGFPSSPSIQVFSLKVFYIYLRVSRALNNQPVSFYVVRSS